MPRPEICVLARASGSTPWGRIGAAFSRGFEELGVRCDVVYVTAPRRTETRGPVRVIGLGTRPRAAVRPIARYLSEAKPRLTFATSGVVAPVALCAGKLTGQLVVPWETAFIELDQGSSPVALRGRLNPLAQRMTYRWAPAIAVVSRDVGAHVAKTYKRALGRDVYELPNPLDIEQVLTGAEGAAQVTEDGFRLCASGRLKKSKGVDVLLKALYLRAGELPVDWSLTVLGEGEWRGKLEGLSARYGLADRVQLLGRCENPYPLMRAADIFVHPARWEGFGLVLTEALALGVPIVATRCPGGPREILDEGRYGRLVPPEDPAALGDALVRLAASTEERSELSQRGPERARDYSPARVATEMMRVADHVDGAG